MTGQSTTVLNARNRCLHLVSEHGLDLEMHGPMVWLKFYFDRKGVFLRGWIAAADYLTAECARRDMEEAQESLT